MKIKNIIRLTLVAILFLSSNCKSTNEPVDTGNEPQPPGPETGGQTGTGIFHTKGVQLKTLDVISANALTDKQKVLIATLQGIASKTSSEQIYIDEGGPGEVWKNYLQSNYAISLKDYASWNTLLSRFKSLVSGYILYDRASNPRSLTAATSLCGPINAIAVDISLEAEVRSLGITTLKADVRNRDEQWVYENYATSFSKKVAAEQDPAINHHLRDYITLTNAFTFYDGITAFRTSVMQGLNPEAFCLGYYAPDEFNMVANAAQEGVVMIPTDLAPNLSALSSIYNTEGLTQDTYTTPATEENVHYVTFLSSDGDNIGFNLWSFHNYFSDANRSTFNMGYTINPALVDLAPAALHWYYEKASKGTYKDFFVAGPSGSGYTFPSKMPSADLDTYLSRLNTFMEKADLNIVNILDQGAYQRTDLWDKYLTQPNIDALLYTGYGESPLGRISFSTNGKPIIEARDNLWAGLEEESDVISNINARPADPHSSAGYTLVFVHVWTKSLSNIKTVIAGLNPNVRVVTPDAFVQLVKANVTSSDNGSVESITDGATYRLINLHSGKSLDVAARSQDDGANVLQWTYNNDENQQWIFTSLGNDYYKIAAVHSGKVLEVAGASTIAGGNVDQSTWTGADHQIWKVISNGDDTFRLINKNSNLVLDIHNGSTDNGANIQQESASDANHKKWLIQLP